MKSCNFKLAAFLFRDISKQFRRRVQQMRVKGVQLFFQTLGFFQQFRFVECKPTALRVPDVCDEPHVFRRLFGRYFFQIFDLRAFRPVLVQLIHFSFCVSLRASFWPLRGWSFFGAVHAWVSGAIFPGSYSGRIRNRRCTKRTSRFPSCKSVRTTGNPGNQSLRSFRTDTGRIWS